METLALTITAGDVLRVGSVYYTVTKTQIVGDVITMALISQTTGKERIIARKGKRATVCKVAN